MNNKGLTTNNGNSIHRILNTDIKKDPNPQEDEIILGCGCRGAENVFETQELSRHL